MKFIPLILLTTLSLSASEWSTNFVLMAFETNNVTCSLRLLRPASVDEISGSGWVSNGLPPAPPSQYIGWVVPGTNSGPNVMLTNSAIAHPERKHRIIAYRKECPECGVTLTSTNITSWIVSDGTTNSIRMTTVSFECLGCGEAYFETFQKPIRNTKVEEITAEVVK